MFDPNNQIHPHFQPYVQHALQALQSEVINKREVNQARAIIYNECCRSFDPSYNPFVYQMLLVTSQVALYKVMIERMSIEQAIGIAADMVLTFKAAKIMATTPAMIPDQTAYAIVNQTMQQSLHFEQQLGQFLNQLAAQVNGGFQQTSQPLGNTFGTVNNYQPSNMGGFGGGGFGVNTGFGNPAPFGAPANTGFGFGSNLPNQPNRSAGVNANSAFFQPQAHVSDMGKNDGSAMAAMNRSLDVNSLLTKPEVPMTPKQPENNVIPLNAPQARPPKKFTVSLKDKPVPSISNKVIEEAVFAPSRDHWDEREFQVENEMTMPKTIKASSVRWVSEDEVIVPTVDPVHIGRAPGADDVVIPDGERKRTFSPRRPYALVYDKAHHFMAHLLEDDGKLPDGKSVGEVIVKYEQPIDQEAMEEDMLYSQHETDAVNREDISTLEREALGLKFLPHKLFNKKDPSTEEALEKALEADAYWQELSEQKAAEPETAIEAARNELAEMNKTLGRFTFKFERVIPLVDEQESNAVAGLVDSLHSLEPTKIIAALKVVQKNSSSPKIYDYMSEMLTRWLRALLNQRMGIPWTLTSFEEDYYDIVDLIQEKHGEAITDIFGNKMVEMLDKMTRNFSVTKRTENSKFADKFTVSWDYHVWITDIPQRKLRLKCSEKSGSLQRESAEHLYKVCEYVISEQDSAGLWCSLLVTSGNEIIRIFPGAYDQSQILIGFD